MAQVKKNLEMWTEDVGRMPVRTTRVPHPKLAVPFGEVRVGILFSN
jgi:hypothetical protein